MEYGYVKPGSEAIEHPTTLDIAWAAGIFEGEGSCRAKITDRGYIGSAIVIVNQKKPWILQRLQALFGGTLRYRDRSKYNSIPQFLEGRQIIHSELWDWRISGARARGFIMTIYKFLSPHRKAQIEKTLGLGRSPRIVSKRRAKDSGEDFI